MIQPQPPEEVLKAFGHDPDAVTLTAITHGLINGTWKLEWHGYARILQQLNHQVFTQPQWVTENIAMVAMYLQQDAPDYLFPQPVAALDGNHLVQVADGYFRMFEFIPDAHTVTVVNEMQAWEAAHQFGKFTARLARFPAERLHITIPHFHDLTYRYQQFQEALKNADASRIEQAQTLIEKVKANASIVEAYANLMEQQQLKSRVTHHDTKISNVLFDGNNKGLCVIDLDTVMPGYFISDMGDMFRTYLCPVTEEETDLNKVIVRPEIYRAIVDGYRTAMGNELTEQELPHIFYAGQFMIYMQAIRFLADHLNGNIYYQTRYPRHNLDRAANQFKLLEQYNAMRSLV